MAEETTSQYKKPHPNVISGWQQKKYLMPNTKLSGLTPFIKLYSIFNEDEGLLYQSVIQSNANRTDNNPRLPDGFIESFQRAIILAVEGADNSSISTINSALVGSENGPLYMIDMNRPEAQGSSNNWTGGFGIKDMSCNRTTESPFSETFSLTVTLNDPSLVRNRYEYNKLLTVGSNFLLMYGWSSGAPNSFFDKNQNTFSLNFNEDVYYNGKDFRYVFVQLHKFAWDFNNLGQMEGTLDFVAAQNSEVIFNMGGKMSSLGKSVQYFMNSRLLGGPPRADAAIDSIGTFNRDGEEQDVSIGETTAAEALFENLGGLDEADNDNHAEQTARIANLAMVGFLGDVDIFVTAGPARSDGGRKDRQVHRRIQELFDQDADRLYGAEVKPNTVLGKLNGNREAILQLAEDEPERFRRALNESERLERIGSVVDGSFIEDKSSTWSQAPNGWGEGQKLNILGLSALFIPIVYNRQTGEVDYSGNRTNRTRNAGRVKIKWVAQDNKNKAENKKYNLRKSGGNAAIKNAEDFTNISESISLSESRFDKLFSGKALFESGDLNIPESYTETFRDLPEGVIITKYGVGTAKRPGLNADGDIVNGYQNNNYVLGEDIIYYYLGWVVEAFKYYEHKYSNKRINIVYSELGESQISEPFARFQNQFRSRIAKETSNELGESPSYEADSLVAIRDPSSQSGDNYRVESSIIPSARPKSKEWAVDENGNALQGVYYEEIENIVPNLLQPTDSAFFVSGPEGSGYKVLVDEKFDVFLKFKRGFRLTKGQTLTPDTPRDVKIRQKGSSIFFPIGVTLPIKKIVSGEDADDKDFKNIDTVGLKTTRISNTAEVLLDADKVDEVLDNSQGRSFPDIITKILTECVAMPDLGLVLVPLSNGDLSIQAAGAMSADEVKFNADYNPDVDSIIAEGQNFIIDYRTKNSLLKSLSVTAKMDPNIAFLYGASVRGPNGRRDILKIIKENRSSLDQEGRAPNPNMVDFGAFARNYMLKNRPNDADTLASIQAFEGQLSGTATVAADDEETFNELLESIPEGLFAEYMSQDYSLYEKLAIERMNNSNQLSQMFSYYMNQLTATIHGTTGLECMQIVQIRNVAGLIDGFYCIIGISEKIGVNDFITELNLMLVAPSTILEPTIGAY